MDKITFNIGTAFNSPIGQGDFGLTNLVSIILSNALAVAGLLLLIFTAFVLRIVGVEILGLPEFGG